MNEHERLKKLEEELKGFMLRQAVTGEKIAGMEKEIEAAKCGLVDGSKGAARKIEDFEGRLRPLRWEGQGILVKIDELKVKISEAQDAVRQIEAEEKASLEQYCHEREVKECTELVAGFEGRMEKFIDSYISSCEQLAELQLLGTRAAGCGIDTSTITDRLFRLKPIVDGRIRQEGLKYLVSAGTPGELVLWPVTREKSVITRDIEAGRKETRRAGWRKEFQIKKGEN